MSFSHELGGGVFRRPISGTYQTVEVTTTTLVADPKSTRVSIQNVSTPDIWVGFDAVAGSNGMRLEKGDMMTLSLEELDIDRLKMVAESSPGNVYIMQEGI